MCHAWLLPSDINVTVEHYWKDDAPSHALAELGRLGQGPETGTTEWALEERRTIELTPWYEALVGTVNNTCPAG
jgi:hypothetical protein